MSLPKTVEHQYSPIMADIYGSQIYVLPRSGLADGEDEDDIIVKHDSLKASGKKQPLVFTNGFEKLGHSNSRTPLLCLQDKVLVLKDASIPADWNWSTSFRRRGFENARSQTKLLMWVQNFKRGQKNSAPRKPEPFMGWVKTTIFTLITDHMKWNCWSPERQRQKKEKGRTHRSLRSLLTVFLMLTHRPKKSLVPPPRLSKVNRNSQWQVRSTYKVYTHSSFYYCMLKCSTI